MNLSEETELRRIKVNTELDPERRSQLGQFFTPIAISNFMNSLFRDLDRDITLLEPSCGVGNLVASFVDRRNETSSNNKLDIELYEIEKVIFPYLEETITRMELVSKNISVNLNRTDFIVNRCEKLGLPLFASGKKTYTHVVMNPPYKKIKSNGLHHKLLSNVGVETVNLYTSFVLLSISQMAEQGEIVIIIPRSFCNGPYYKSFREYLFEQINIRQIHIFNNRNDVFGENDVLQENIILYGIKSKTQGDIIVSNSDTSNFYLNNEGKYVTDDYHEYTVPFETLVDSADNEKFLHIVTSNFDLLIKHRMNSFNCSLPELGLMVSTGPIVSFRMKEDIFTNLSNDTHPLLYPIHLKNWKVTYPGESKKPNAIRISKKTRAYLWENKGYFLLVKRFSSKEEKKRISCAIYNGSLPGEYIGFDNKLNVFHFQKEGLPKAIVYGLFIYLNSTLIDSYYRHFGGHTQINSTDLRNIKYPTREQLIRLGQLSMKYEEFTQTIIDDILNQIIKENSDDMEKDPVQIRKKIDDAIEILNLLGLPRQQQNDRSGLTLLSLIDLKPDGLWSDLQRPILGVTPIMEWVMKNYLVEYKPNTRETFRRQTIHQFVEDGLVLYNPDKPDRPVNSPQACYQITEELLNLLVSFRTKKWNNNLSKYLANKQTLIERYSKIRSMEMLSLRLSGDKEFKLTPGKHSQLIVDIVMKFGPRFCPGAEVAYLGDTGSKVEFFNDALFEELGIALNKKGKLPDVILYQREKGWLFLIESVTSHGPVNPKRYIELNALFSKNDLGLIFVTSFPDRNIMSRFLSEISWETEVWISDAPTHLIHFNGDKFMGPR